MFKLLLVQLQYMLYQELLGSSYTDSHIHLKSIVLDNIFINHQTRRKEPKM